jgi:hypothetical protein
MDLMYDLYLQYWQHCRWMDPSNLEDISIMKKKLVKLQSESDLALLSTCSLISLQEILTTVRDESLQGHTDYDSYYSSGGENPPISEYRSKRPPAPLVAFSMPKFRQPMLPMLALGLPPLLPFQSGLPEVCTIDISVSPSQCSQPFSTNVLHRHKSCKTHCTPT